MQRFTDLRVWQASHQLALDLYELTGHFPAEERLGLCSQARRAAVSIAANIAEGSKRDSRLDYARFLNIAEASAAEVEECLLLARDLGFAPREAVAGLLERVDHVARMLSRLRQQVLRRQRAVPVAAGEQTPNASPPALARSVEEEHV